MSVIRMFTVAGVLLLSACGGQFDSTMQADTTASADDNGPPQVCVPGQPDPRACTPAETWKTTVCHIPPGNPANKHTICVGNPAVPAHLAHGDFLGSCCGAGTPTPPPTDDMGPPPPPPPPAADMSGIPPATTPIP